MLSAKRWSGLGWLVLGISLTLAGCGGSGGGSAGATAAGYRLYSSYAQKGPFITGSTVSAQEVDEKLVPTGKQYVYEVTTNIGTFVPGNKFYSRYVSLSVNGYYFDELRNRVSNSPLTLSAYGDLRVASVNVNILTTLAYLRIQTLVSQSGLGFQTARSVAQKQVLAAFHIRNASGFDDFDQLDIRRQHDDDYALLAISSIFLQASLSTDLSQLIADFQSDIADNGVIDNAYIKQAISDASKSLNPDVIASNVTAKYKSIVNVQSGFRGSFIAQWIDQDGGGVIGKYTSVQENVQASTAYDSPRYTAGSDDDLGSAAVTAGTLIVNGTPVPNGTIVHEGDKLVVSLVSGALPNDSVTGQITIKPFNAVNSIPAAQFTIITAPIPVSVAAQLDSVGSPGDLALSPDNNTLYIASMPIDPQLEPQQNDGGLYIYDVTDITAPNKLNLVQYPVAGLLAGYYGVSLSDDGLTAYIASSQQELQAIDLTSFTNTNLISRIGTDGLAMSIVKQPGLSSVIVGTSTHEVQQFDISVPNTPRLTATDSINIQPWGLTISPDNSQLIAYSTKSQFTDLIDLTTHTLVASSNIIAAVYTGNQQLFAVGANGGTLIFETIDLTDPSQPVSLGQGSVGLSSSYNGNGIGVTYVPSIHMAYVVVLGKVFLIDLSNLSSPMMRGSISLPPYSHSSSLLLSPKIVANSDGSRIYVSWRTAVYALQVGN